MISGLKRALELLKMSGWSGPEHEPMCRASDGGSCFEDYEGLSRFSVAGALLATDCYPDGWDALEAVVSPNWFAWRTFYAADPDAVTEAELRRFRKLSAYLRGELDLQAWLREPQRTTEEVLRAFVRAIERSKKSGERR